MKKKNSFGFKRKDNLEKYFSSINKNGSFGGKESVSGPGSDPEIVNLFLSDLISRIKDLKIKSMYDVPCGDFLWMKNVISTLQIEYTGFDIDQELVNNNQLNYGTKLVNFKKLDLVNRKLGKADLIFCRDLLVHLTLIDAMKAMHNMLHSKAKYLAITSFPDEEMNQDLDYDDSNLGIVPWRPLNLELEPFKLPKPIFQIREGCMEFDARRKYDDKSIFFYDLNEIRDIR